MCTVAPLFAFYRFYRTKRDMISIQNKWQYSTVSVQVVVLWTDNINHWTGMSTHPYCMMHVEFMDIKCQSLFDFNFYCDININITVSDRFDYSVITSCQKAENILNLFFQTDTKSMFSFVLHWDNARQRRT